MLRYSTKGCTRLVLVRNAQTEKNKEECKGVFVSKICTKNGLNLGNINPDECKCINCIPTTDLSLTEKGKEMAWALRKIIEYLKVKLHPVQEEKEPQKKFKIYIDGTNSQHTLTAAPLCGIARNVSQVISGEDFNHVIGDDIRKQIQDQEENIITYIIAFTNAHTIQRLVNRVVDKDIIFGPALGSTTIIDVGIDDNSDLGFFGAGGYFIHELGGLGALQYGGFDTSEIRMWNNSK